VPPHLPPNDPPIIQVTNGGNDPLSSEEKNWATFAHLASILGWIGIPFANIGAPLIIWLMKKDEMPFAAEQAKECLNFQITMTIIVTISGLLILSLVGAVIGIPALLIIAVVDVICTIDGSIKASRGEDYHYPFTLRLIK